jgi:tetrapyrrole methylase family protein / MazG family protein
MKELESDEKHPLELMFTAQDVSAKLGFDFKTIDLAMDKVHEELEEMTEAYKAREENWQHFEEELGDCFFSLINLCRHAKISPKEALKANVKKYLKRCQYIESVLKEKGQEWRDIPLEEIYILWKQYKKVEKKETTPCQ